MQRLVHSSIQKQRCRLNLHRIKDQEPTRLRTLTSSRTTTITAYDVVAYDVIANDATYDATIVLATNDVVAYGNVLTARYGYGHDATTRYVSVTRYVSAARYVLAPWNDVARYVDEHGIPWSDNFFRTSAHL